MGKTVDDICCLLETGGGTQIGEKQFYTIATRLLCQIATGGAAGADSEILQLCDDQGGGVVVPFLRIVSVPPGGGPATITDTTLDGVTPYVVVGTATLCFTTVADSEILTLCDVQASGERIKFLRFISISSSGVVTTTDTELDGTTVYVVVGTVEDCDRQIGVEELGNEVLAVTDAIALSLASIPAGAIGATLQVQVTAGVGALRYRTNGVAPTAGIGLRVFDNANIFLGVVPEIFGGDPGQLAGFRTIAEAGITADLFVTYYGG